MSENSEIPMFCDAPPDIFSKARYLRKNMTSAEVKVWNLLKGKNILGVKFRSQHPLGIYIADFYCHSLNLVVEIDGNIHESIEKAGYDNQRTRDLNNWELDVIRFTNEEVYYHFEMVKDRIIKEVQTRLQSPSLQQNKSPL